MKPFHYRLTSSMAVPAVVGLVMALLFLRIPDSTTQDKPVDPFLSIYHSLITSPEGTDETLPDSLFRLLLALHQDQPGKYDTLIPALINRKIQHTPEGMNADERLQYLMSFRPVMDHLQKIAHGDIAEYYALFLPVFWFHYQTDSLAHYLDLIDDHLRQEAQPDELRITWWYEKGRLAMTRGDYDAGLTFFNQGLQYLDAHFPDHIRMKINLLNAMGIGYRRTGQTQEAITHFERILQVHQAEIHSVHMTGTILNNLGLACKDLGKWETAITYISQAIDYYTVFKSPAYADIGSGYDNIAICYQAWGQLDSALTYSQKSLEFIQQNLGEEHPDLLLPMCSMISTFWQQKKHVEALVLYNQAISLLHTLGWTPDNPSGDYYLSDGFDVFAYGAAILGALYHETLDTTYLIRAIEAGDHFMGLTDYAYDHIQQDLSKDIFQLKHGADFSLCIDNLYTRYRITGDPGDLQKAFIYAEKYKSLELLYAAQKDKAGQVGRFQTLNAQHRNFQDSIRHYEEILTAGHANPILQDQLERLQQEFFVWKERLQKEEPEYYQLVYHPEPVPVEVLQQQLIPHTQCMLSYHLASDAVYMFLIRSDTALFFRHEIEADLPGTITAFRYAIRDFSTSVTRSDSGYVESAERFCDAGSALYSMLIEPVSPWLTDRTVIVVDKALGYVPFDLLLSEKPETPHHFRDHAYLLRTHALSYSYSARLWMDMQTQQRNKGRRLMAMAPGYDQHDHTKHEDQDWQNSLRPLRYNQAEVHAVASIWPGTSWTGKEATASQFIRHASCFRLIHLATHSQAHDEQGDFSFLVFADTTAGHSRLMAGDIYNLRLRADIVTLSACETGLGPLRSGEGIISLARAFAFAGARSIISSLWSVNDQSTLQIMTGFYRQLRAGQPKDIAMQQAKLEYLVQMGHTDAHPFLWAAFICVGDMHPLSGTFSFWWILLPLGIGLLAGVFIFYKKNRNLVGTSR